MTSKDAILKEIERGLKELEEELDRLRERSINFKDDTREKYQEDLDEIKVQKEAFYATLTKLTDASEKEWGSIKNRVSEELNALKDKTSAMIDKYQQ